MGKRLGPYILGTNYWRREASFARNYRDFPEKVNHGLGGRYNPSLILALWKLGLDSTIQTYKVPLLCRDREKL